MKKINQKYYWIVFRKNKRKKLIIYIASKKVFSNFTSPSFVDVRLGALKWINLSDVFFVCIDVILNCRGPPLINSKKRIDWRIRKWLIDQNKEKRWTIHIT